MPQDIPTQMLTHVAFKSPPPSGHTQTDRHAETVVTATDKLMNVREYLHVGTHAAAGQMHTDGPEQMLTQVACESPPL